MKANKLNNKTSSNLYSITIRTGNGVILGSNPVNDLFAYITKNFQYFLFSIEKEENEAHFQGMVFAEPSKRQDNVRRDLMKYTEAMYIEGLGDNLPTTKGLSAMRKYALKVSAHNDFNTLVRYVLKDGIVHNRTPCISRLPKDLQYYVPEQYCQHNEVKTYCSLCYKEEDPEVEYLPPDGYERTRHYETGKWFLRKLPKKNYFLCE